MSANIVVDEQTGEVIEVPDTTEVAKKEEFDLLFTDEYLDYQYQLQGIKEQIAIYEAKRKEQIKEFFKKYGIKSFSNRYISVTYVAPHETTSVDTAKLKKDGIYDKYTKKSTVKESIRVSVKEDD